MMDDNIDILFYSRDPGGTNVLVPMILFFEKSYHVEVYGKDFAISIYEKEGIRCTNIEHVMGEIDEETVDAFLADRRPRLVMTGTSTIDRSEHFFWKACKNLGIKCFANVDSWAFYKERFSVDEKSVSNLSSRSEKYFFPDYVLAVDEQARDGMVSDGIPYDQTVIAGYWHFLHQQRKLDKRDKSKVEKYKKLLTQGDRGRKIILFLSECFSELFGEDPNSGYGYHEKTIFSALENALEPYKAGESFLIVIRPHPKEKLEWWNKKKRQSSIEMVIDFKADLLEQIEVADIVTGMQTQCLNDALLVGKKAISIQIGLNRNNPLFSSRQGLINTALRESDLERFISCFFSGELKESKFEPDVSDISDFIEFTQEVIRNG